MIKFQPYKGCNCDWCKGSKQHMSRSGSKNYRFWRKFARRQFRRTGQNIDLNYETPPFKSTERWY